MSRLLRAAGFFFLAALLFAAPIFAAIEWGLAGLLSLVAIFVAWHGGMTWEAIRRKPSDDAFDRHIRPRLKGEDWWRSR